MVSREICLENSEVDVPTLKNLRLTLKIACMLVDNFVVSRRVCLWGDNSLEVKEGVQMQQGYMRVGH